VKRLRVAVAGAGYFAQFHLDGWRRIPGVELVGVCDPEKDKAQALAARFGVPRAFGALPEMLESSGADLLDIVAPPASHAALLGEAVRRGLATVCQKPFGRSYAEARELTGLAGRAGIMLAVHENFRFMPHFREMKRWVDAGGLGALHSIAFRLRPGDGQGPQAYLSRQPSFQKMPRFLVFETAIHFIDTFRFLVGEVEAVTARLRRLNPVIAGEDAGILVFEFAGGATGLFDGNRLNDHVAANPRRTMGECWLEGEAGVLRLDGDARLWWKPHQQPETEHAYDRGRDDTFGGGACDLLQAHVARHLREGAPLENAAEAYLPNMRILEAAYASHAAGRRIEIAGFEPGELR
jgi:predicted dehydrogenase